jgi:hypothetical protein
MPFDWEAHSRKARITHSELWKADPWKYVDSAIQTLKVAAVAMVKNVDMNPEEREMWFEHMLASITDPLRAWWEHLKKDRRPT